jgi:hypothetical protein
MRRFRTIISYGRKRTLLDLSWVYAELAPYYSEIGRPSIGPVLMIRMLIIGYVFLLSDRSGKSAGRFK